MSKFTNLRNALTLHTTKLALWWGQATTSQRAMFSTILLALGVAVVVLSVAGLLSFLS